jgi:hypothetical protein
MLERIIVVTVLVLASCTESMTQDSETTSAQRVDLAPSRSKEETLPALTTHVVCSWGTVGISVPGSQPGWVIGMFDLRGLRDVRGLRLDSIELLDGQGRPVATATTELELRSVPPERSNRDYSQDGTLDFDGLVSAGQTARLWMHGRLGGDFDAISAAAPVRYRAVLVTADGAQLTVEGPLDPPWGTS